MTSKYSEFAVKMKKVILLVSMVLLFCSVKSYSQEKGFGLGVMIGEPTGISGKYWLNETNALDFSLAYSFVHDKSAVSLHGDYLFHLPHLIKSELNLPFYYGFGGRIHFNNKSKSTIGARGVAGIMWIPNSLPIDTFFEIAPVFNLFPETSLQLDLAIGCRYYFK